MGRRLLPPSTTTVFYETFAQIAIACSDQFTAVGSSSNARTLTVPGTMSCELGKISSITTKSEARLACLEIAFSRR